MAALATPTPWRWTREDFVRLADAGYFGPEARVELIEGEVLQKVGQGNAHIYSVTALAEALRTVFGGDYLVRQQLALPLAARSQPEPDVSVLRGPAERYDGRDPSLEDVALVVEVSDSSLAFDRGPKLAMYARAGIGEYWILNLVDRRLEVHRRPLAELGAFGDVTLVGEGEGVGPLAVPDGRVDVARLLPRNRAQELFKSAD
jgi:Uma2 family endonuclease